MPLFKTIRDGQRAQLLDRQGRATVIDGPLRVQVVTKQFHRMQRLSADQKQYIKVFYSNGVVEHIPGPSSIFEDPLYMDRAEVCNAISLDANEVLVVYQQMREDDGLVRRRIQHGPTLFSPSADEWMHQFVWHGTDPNNKTRKVPGGLKFQRLRVIPDQFYYNIPDVRTKDDALIVIKVMIFFELRDIDKMLNQTADPIGDFINSVQADVIAFASQLSYEEFIESSGRLNDLENYIQLRERSQRIGYEIGKVVYRGYQASDKLQRLHDKAIEKRTQLKVEMEAEKQRQDLTDSKLLNKQQRSIVQQSLELEETKHRHTLKLESILHQLKLDEQSHEEELRREKMTKLAEIKAQQQRYDQEVAYLSNLASLGVNITEYLISQHPKPGRTVRVVTAAGSSDNGPIHIHP